MRRKETEASSRAGAECTTTRRDIQLHRTNPSLEDGTPQLEDPVVNGV